MLSSVANAFIHVFPTSPLRAEVGFDTKISLHYEVFDISECRLTIWDI